MPAAKKKSLSSAHCRILTLLADLAMTDEASLTPGTKFFEDLGFDSIDFVEMVMELEESFGMQIPDDQAEKLLTVGKICEYVDKHQVVMA